MKMKEITIIGAGLAGSEAAWQLARRHIPVRLYEMRPGKKTPAHHTGYFSELVCSNSLRATGLENAVGVLKEELALWDSLIISEAKKHAVLAGNSLAVDREGFARGVSAALRKHPDITIIQEEVSKIPPGPAIIATGPLTSDSLHTAIADITADDDLYFYDAAAPIITKESIDFSKAYYKSRYDKGDGEYINCPLTEDEFERFYEAVIHAETVTPKDFEERFFEGCMPFEVMAARGEKTLLFGPMKPVGLEKDGVRPYAVVQLRQDNAEGTLYNIVGFQTRLTWPEQKRVIRMIPGLEHAGFVRYGVMHRNTYLNAPRLLNACQQFKDRDDLFFAGQMTGVEGYVESCASGLMAAVHIAHYINEETLLPFPETTVMGALDHYITTANAEGFQPMKANFGILPPLTVQHKKKDRKMLYARRALEDAGAFREIYHA